MPLFDEFPTSRSYYATPETRSAAPPAAARAASSTRKTGVAQSNDRVSRSAVDGASQAADFGSRRMTRLEASLRAMGFFEPKPPTVDQHMASAPLDRDARMEHIQNMRGPLVHERDLNNPSKSRRAALDETIKKLDGHFDDAVYGRYPGASYTQASREAGEKLRSNYANLGYFFPPDSPGFIPKNYQGKEIPTPVEQPQPSRRSTAGPSAAPRTAPTQETPTASTTKNAPPNNLRVIRGIAAGTPRQTLHEGSRYIPAVTKDNGNGGVITVNRAKVLVDARHTSPGFQKYAGTQLARFDPATKMLVFKQSDPSYRQGRNPVDLSESEVALVNGYGYQLPGMAA